MATEVALLHLRDDLGNDPDLTTNEAYRDTLTTLKQQKGFQRVYWGKQLETLSILLFFVDWDSVEDHVIFTKSDGYAAFMDRFGEVIDMTRGQVYHMIATPHPPLVLGSTVAPVTEIWTIAFPVGFSEDLQGKFGETWAEFLAVVEGQEGFRGSAGGWVLEDIDVPGREEKVKVYHAFIGWESLEAARRFRGRSAFKRAIAPVRRAKNLVNIVVTHYTGMMEDKSS